MNRNIEADAMMVRLEHPADEITDLIHIISRKKTMKRGFEICAVVHRDGIPRHTVMKRTILRSCAFGA